MIEDFKSYPYQEAVVKETGKRVVVEWSDEEQNWYDEIEEVTYTSDELDFSYHHNKINFAHAFPLMLAKDVLCSIISTQGVGETEYEIEEQVNTAMRYVDKFAKISSKSYFDPILLHSIKAFEI